MIKGESSWDRVSDWYGKTVGEGGHYFHQQVILPKSLELLDLKDSSSLLDLACGQGVLARCIPQETEYLGVDSSAALIKQARQLDKNSKHSYLMADVCKPIQAREGHYSHSAMILSLQNIKDTAAVIRNTGKHLQKKGLLLIVINHPYFRIPRQTRWEIDDKNKVQYRRIDRYMTPLDIPINAHPGQGKRSDITWSYHVPLSKYSRVLCDNGFIIEKLEEWISDKHSVGDAAKMENRARKEFPLFMAILARKSLN
jgi:SAM-dependent methyltransferase